MASTVAKERPLSPHLTIYAFRVNMITSVIFRGTGIFMMAGLAALSIAYLPAGRDVKAYVHTLQQYPFLCALVKAGIVFPLTYHFLGGMRHLAWDNIIGHNMNFVSRTGWGAVGVAGAAALVAMFTEYEE